LGVVVVIKVVKEPRVYLIQSGQINHEELYAFLENNTCNGGVGLGFQDNSPTDVVPEIAGRLCYLSFDKPRPGGNKAYLGHIKEVGHGSVLEHSVFTFIIDDVSRSLTHELVRHRVGTAFSQVSQRYVDHRVNKSTSNGEQVGWSFVVPWNLIGRRGLYEKWLLHMANSLKLYDIIAQQLIADGVERKDAFEDARSVLPEATVTKIVVSFNVRSLRHFLKLRGGAGAAKEIRSLAIKLWEKVRHYEVFSDVKLCTAYSAGEHKIGTLEVQYAT
jgi:thymidylate synthase (FAD)